MKASEEVTDKLCAWITKVIKWVKNKFDLGCKKCKQIAHHTLNVCIFFIHKKIFRWVIRFRYLSYWIPQHTKLVRRTFLIVCAAILAHALIKFTDPSSVSISNFAEYFSAIGAMVGGVLAVVFSLTIFGQQSILDIHSTKLLHKYVYGTLEKSTFFGVSLITLLFFAASRWSANLIQPNPITYTILVYGSFVLVALVFVLVDLLYQRVSSTNSSSKTLSK